MEKDLHRLTVRLTQQEYRNLKALSIETKRPIAEIVRQKLASIPTGFSVPICTEHNEKFKQQVNGVWACPEMLCANFVRFEIAS